MAGVRTRCNQRAKQNCKDRCTDDWRAAPEHRRDNGNRKGEKEPEHQRGRTIKVIAPEELRPDSFLRSGTFTWVRRHMKMNRRDICTGLAAGAAATATIPAHAAAQSGFGAPHPPIVPEDDPAITVERLQLRRPDGTVNAYAAYPKQVTATTPGIVLCMAIWGVDDQLRDTMRRFAKAGYMCIAPDLYSRMGAPSGDGATDFSYLSSRSRRSCSASSTMAICVPAA